MALRPQTSIVTVMATQSLYRRYRPRRFSEVRGQDHVVKALRTSVAEGREGQAYLFSGPRGTGKTTSARILAKVLNCTEVLDGEPCCECESCLSVERGTSYDVHELDAASNNGVDSMRDLIDKASLGTPGRHKVYILDEVHMLTKPAEAALLKTLEEPPPHVVFVLATTDPQKMSDTIRSRTQHLQFHLLPADTLQQHVRWVADNAGLVVSDAAIQQVLAQGAGSARDALSALELVANTGGDGVETVPIEEFVEAMIERDPGRALKLAAGAVGLGRDPRTLTEEIIGFLRDGFLSIMAPDLVQLSSDRVATLLEQSQRLGAAGLVRGIEQLGAALTEMRHAPDPRVLLDVAIVKLTSDSAAGGDSGAAIGVLTARIAKLEQQLAGALNTATRPAANQATPTADEPETPTVDAPRDEATGRAALGGRVQRSQSAAKTAPAASKDRVERAPAAGAARQPEPSPSPASATFEPAAAATSEGAAMNQSLWDDTIKPGLRGMARAVFSPATYVSNTDTVLTLSLPNPVHRDKCEQHRAAVEQALTAAVGGPVSLELVLAGGSGGDSSSVGGGPSSSPATARRSAEPTTQAPPPANEPPINPEEPAADPQTDSLVVNDDALANNASHRQQSESPRRTAERKAAQAQASETPLQGDEGGLEEAGAEIDVLPEDHEVDLTELVDAPPETVRMPIDRLAEAFPGAELVTETY
jgi:DNA polymerase III subunit gamma/tau